MRRIPTASEHDDGATELEKPVHKEGDVVEIRPGLTKGIKRQGFGDWPQDGQKVCVHYTGTLEDGTVFDTSRKRSNSKGLTFTLGLREVISGWDRGIATMRAGELSVFKMAPEHAYGKEGLKYSIITPDATLFFEIELLDDNAQGTLWQRLKWQLYGFIVFVVILVSILVAEGVVSLPAIKHPINKAEVFAAYSSAVTEGLS